MALAAQKNDSTKNIHFFEKIWSFPHLEGMKQRTLFLPWLYPLFLMPLMLHAQLYQPIAVEGAHWIVGKDWLETLWLDEKFSLTIRGDTVVNGQIYKQVWRETFEFEENSKQFTDRIISSIPYALIRDDTLQQKVYAITGMASDNHCPEDEEYLLFDFSVSEGDTLDWCSLHNFRLDEGSQITADSIRFTQAPFWEGVRKTIYTVFATTLYNDALLGETIIPIVEGFGYLHTDPFLEGNFLIDYCIGSNWDCRLLSNTPEPAKKDLKIYPNPVKDLLIVEYNGSENTHLYPTTLQIIAPTGQMIHEMIIRQYRDQIHLYDIPLGIYFIRLSNKQCILHQSWLVIQ